VQEGDSVKKGQVLARVYADILSTQRDQAAAVVNQQQAQVENTQASLEAFKARLEQAERQYLRQKQLYDEKVISKLEFEQADNAYRTAKADYNAAVKSISGSRAGVTSAQANLNRANKDLSRTTIVAPMDGVVSLLNVKRGERVVGNSMMAGTEMMRVADMRVIEVRVDVGENDVPKVKIGDSAVIEVDAYSNRKFKGVVTQIASSTRTTSGTLSTNDVTNYEIRIRLDPASYQDLLDPTKARNFPFRPGMSASADIQTKTHSNIIAVPINAVTTREKTDSTADNAKGKEKGKEKKEATETSANTTGNVDDLVEVVFIKNADNTVKKVPVKTSIQDISYIEILEGVKEGDEIITGPYTIVSKTLNDGMKVEVVPKEQLFDTKEKKN
jgi:HlyD family secretion protein